MTEIRHATTTDAPAEAVIRAVTTQEGLRAFWTDQSYAKGEAGSESIFEFGPNAETQFKMRVDAIEPSEVSWTCRGGPPEWVGSVVRWSTAAVPDGQTLIRFEQTGLPDDYDAAPISFVWAMVLARLAEYAATGRPNPFFVRNNRMA